MESEPLAEWSVSLPQRIMRKQLVRGTSVSYLGNALAAMLLLSAIGSLVACQGVSAGANSTNPVGSLSLGSASLNFGSVTPGSSRTLTVTATNSGSASVIINSATISTKYFSLSAPSLPATLAAGQSANLSVTFAPNAVGAFSGMASIVSNASDAVTSLSLSGTAANGGLLSSSQASESFGTVTVGSNQKLSETVTNTGGLSITISQVGISGTGFSLSGITAPVTLGAGQSVGFSLSFAPQSAGIANGNVTITSDASIPTLTIPLSGTGTTTVGQLTVYPATLDLGSVVAGASGTASGSVVASGANVTVTAASTNSSVFNVGGLSLPVTIPAGKSTTFTVTFSPQTAGAATASLTFTNNTQPTTTTEALKGTGTPAPTHTVNLSWNSSTSSNITGYNIYRAAYVTSCGSFSKINTGLATSTLYADSNVIDGANYCYATTAVNTNSQESGYSNIVSNVQIPPP
jgi:hypothetical protein